MDKTFKQKQAEREEHFKANMKQETFLCMVGMIESWLQYLGVRNTEEDYEAVECIEAALARTKADFEGYFGKKEQDDEN